MMVKGDYFTGSARARIKQEPRNPYKNSVCGFLLSKWQSKNLGVRKTLCVFLNGRLCLHDSIRQDDPDVQQQLATISQAQTLTALVTAA
jgi:hypothetical protein